MIALDAPAPAELEAMVKGSSFYKAMQLMPAPRRHAMFAIYAFCREVDDIADGDDPPPIKLAKLDLWRRDIEVLGQAQPEQKIARALVQPMTDFGLAKADFIAVIDGMAMDAQADIVAPDLATFDLYCDRVASAVGRLSVKIFGAPGPDGDRVAYHLGRALQITNILRDVVEDAGRGRLYLPRELLERHGVPHDQLDAVLAHPNLKFVCDDLAVMARDQFERAFKAMEACPRAAMRPARLMGAAYRAIFDRLIKRGFADLHHEVKVPTLTKLAIVLRYGLV